MTDVNSEVPDSEVSLYPTQKRYPKSYKLRILAETDALTAPGAVAALLRREGIYSSTLSDFRNQRNLGKLLPPEAKAAETVPPEAKAAETVPRDETQLRKLAKLERDNRKLVRDLAQARLIIDVQKKVSELFEITLADGTDEQENQ